VTARFASVTQPEQWLSRQARRAAYSATRFVRQAEVTWLVVLMTMTLSFVVLSYEFRGAWPLNVYLIPLLLAMNVMSLPRLLLLDLLTALCVVESLTLIPVSALRLLGVVSIALAGLIITLNTRSRTRLGLLPLRGESMLVDLRDRLASQSQLPVLPRDWQAEAVMRSAGGASFSGDFMVAAKTRHGQRLEIVVVDVSGKGVDAGTRSLQLSGAFGGLLGSLPTEAFLPAANAYLMRQEWNEGFATAVHLAVNLETGVFELRTAGHPPAVQFHAGSGKWVVHWTTGPVLGVVDAAEYSVHRGELNVGDALLLYTDGLVESPNRDIAFGIDKLLGEAERLVQMGFAGGAERLVASVNSETDDRALLLLYRT
jgi:Stage II sporulation protein E (SpoIIE)